MSRPSQSTPSLADSKLASVGTGCLVVFAAPFILAGFFMVAGALTLVLAGRPMDGAMLGAFGTVFGGVGVAVVVMGRRAAGQLAERSTLRSTHPDEPWRWRADWASGRVVDESKGQARVIWAFAGFWNLVAIPGGAVAVGSALRTGNLLPLFALIFPAVGLVLLWFAVGTSLRLRKYGTTVLELDRVPVPVGGTLDGVVRLPPGVTGLELEARLACLAIVTSGSGKQRSTRQEVQWEQSERLALSGRGGDEARLRFAIPADAPSAAPDASPAILWRLELRAEVPGVDYDAVFDVPVFRTAETPASAPGSEGLLEPAEPPISAAPYRPPADSPITVETTRRGTEIHFPSARNRGAALTLTVFAVVWSGFVPVFFVAEAGWVLVGLFGAIAALLWMGVGRMWLRWSRVTADRSGLLLTRGPLGGTVELRAADVEAIAVEQGMQAGQTTYFDLHAKAVDGGLHVLGTGVPDRRHADWLADRIRSALWGDSG